MKSNLADRISADSLYTDEIWNVRMRVVPVDSHTVIRPYWIEPRPERLLSDEDIRQHLPDVAERCLAVVHVMEQMRRENL